MRKYRELGQHSGLFIIIVLLIMNHNLFICNVNFAVVSSLLYVLENDCLKERVIKYTLAHTSHN